MANTTWYGDGTATVAVGSRTVTGTDTGWLTEVAGLTPIKVGDKFGIHVGRPIVIEQIISDTELLLADEWPGPAQTDAPYKVELTSPTIAAVEAMRRLLASLSNGNLDSLSEISVGTDDIPIGIGPGVFGTVNKYSLKDGVQFNVAVPDLAGRAAYNGAAAGYRVLVANIGDGRSALYIKNSATSGDWSVPYYITGPVGPAGVNQRGNYSAGTSYAIRDIVQYGGSTWIAKVATTGNAPPTLPTTENTQWLLFARSGTPGVVDRGTYSGATAYAANDIVLNNGSTWIALQPTTGNAPPVLPTESNAYWRLLARKGTDGTGTGDFVGPSGGVATGDIVAFADTTGKAGRKATPAEVKIAAGLGTGPLNGLRNKVINGDFLRWTRGTSQTTTGYGSADRWNNVSAGSTKTTALGGFALGVMPFEDKYYMRTTVTSVAGAGNSVRAIHHLEGVEQLAGKQVTLSYWARTTGADKFMSTELTQIFGNTGSPSAAVTGIGVRKVLLSSTAGISGFQKYAHTFVMPPIIGKTETTNSNVGVQFWFDAGTSFNDRTDNLGQQSGVFDIAHVSLVEGDATQEDDPFGWLPLQQKIALCDRYCTRLTTGFQGGQPGYYLDYYRFPVPMRTTPSVNVVNAGSPVNATLIDPANALSNLGGGFQINVTAAQGYLVGWSANFDAEIS